MTIYVTIFAVRRKLTLSFRGIGDDMRENRSSLRGLKTRLAGRLYR